MSKEITGMGFALCCDAIKEMGDEDYIKPDIHIKRIFKDLNLCEVSEKMNIKDEINVFKAVLKMAEIYFNRTSW